MKKKIKQIINSMFLPFMFGFGLGAGFELSIFFMVKVILGL